jgi:hypothetical protein
MRYLQKRRRIVQGVEKNSSLVGVICSVICVSATDPAEIDNRLLEFRDALHEHVEQRRAQAKKLEITAS